MQRDRSLRWIAFFTILYILLALSWWSVLLYNKDTKIYEQQKELRSIYDRYAITELEHIPSLKELEQSHRRKRQMILGESLFILLSVMISIWLMMKGLIEELRINRQRRNFLLSITHELKTPLAAMRLVLETFFKRDLERAQQQKLMQNGLKEADRLGETIDNLLLTARLEQRYEKSLESNTLSQVVNPILIAYKTRCPNASIVLHDQSNPLQNVILDWRGVEIILTNLLDNAIKYGKQKPNIIIEGSVTSNRMNISVSDDGNGIAADERDRVFEMFYRGGDEERRSRKGSGLGLYIVKEIIRHNGGKIHIKDNHPSGCIFTFYLPMVYEQNTNR
jgi:signal transduction histidine kinase